jgi:hypothetical protein
MTPCRSRGEPGGAGTKTNSFNALFGTRLALDPFNLHAVNGHNEVLLAGSIVLFAHGCGLAAGNKHGLNIGTVLGKNPFSGTIQRVVATEIIEA